MRMVRTPSPVPLRGPASPARGEATTPSPLAAAFISFIAAFLLVGCAPGWVAENRIANDLFRQGRFEEALARYEDVIADHPSAEAAFNAGTALAGLRRDQGALQRLQSAADGAPPSVQAAAHYNRGIVLFRMGDCPGSRDAFAAALQIEPEAADARFNLEVVEREMARPPGQQGSLCLADRAAGREPTPGDSQGDNTEGSAAQGEPGPVDPRSIPSQQMQDLLSTIQRPSGSRDTTLLSDHPNMTLEQALRLLEEVRGRQGTFESLLHATQTGPP
jgi:tetratricopeptide (TPR) repeat protein